MLKKFCNDVVVVVVDVFVVLFVRCFVDGGVICNKMHSCLSVFGAKRGIFVGYGASRGGERAPGGGNFFFAMLCFCVLY